MHSMSHASKEERQLEERDKNKISKLIQVLGSTLLGFCVLDHTLVNEKNVLCRVQGMRHNAFLQECTVNMRVLNNRQKNCMAL